VNLSYSKMLARMALGDGSAVMGESSPAYDASWPPKIMLLHRAG
jgi:hypothetical protein